MHLRLDFTPVTQGSQLTSMNISVSVFDQNGQEIPHNEVIESDWYAALAQEKPEIAKLLQPSLSEVCL
jgi:hypothetical protein